jgi:hypothetical protein
VRDTLARRGGGLTELGEVYLVGLLESLLRPTEPVGERALGLQYIEALNAPPPPRYRALRRVGDHALVICGIFPESLERSLVGPEYYQSLGRQAYRGAATLSPRVTGTPALAGVLTELADGFSAFAAVLADIALETIFRPTDDLVGLYRRWHYGGSEAAVTQLAERGLLPVAPNPNARH